MWPAFISNILVDQSLGLEQIATEFILTWSVSTYNKVFQKKNRYRSESGMTSKTRFEVGPRLPRVGVSSSRSGTHMKGESLYNERFISTIYTYDTPKQRAKNLLSADIK